MTTLAERNLAALKSIVRRHTVQLNGASVEITPPGLLEIVEKIMSGGINSNALASAAAEGVDLGQLLARFPELARWLAVRSLAGNLEAGEAAEIEALVAGLGIDELVDLSDGIATAIMPDGVEAAKKKVLGFLKTRFGLEFSAAA